MFPHGVHGLPPARSGLLWLSVSSAFPLPFWSSLECAPICLRLSSHSEEPRFIGLIPQVSWGERAVQLALGEVKVLLSRAGPLQALPQHLLPLDLSRNRFPEVPEAACQLVSLEGLSLYHNCLRCLNPALGNLTALTYLNLR